MNLAEIIRTRFPERRVVILGDIVADQFLHGTISRVSREAPVFILDHDETDTRAGGAANAAVNVASLGGKPVLVGLAGNDENGKLLRRTLERSGVETSSILWDDGLNTTTKVRVLAGQHYARRQQVIRIDYATRETIAEELYDKLGRGFVAACDGAGAIIVSDYNYGAADPRLLDLAREEAASREIPLLIDSRFRLSQFPGATAATPNQEEVEQILGKNFTEEACMSLRESLGYKSLLVTCGNQGMILYGENGPPEHFEAVGSKEPVDVTGAGDTVIGTFALGLASGMSFSDAAAIANHAGGIVVMKRGTASVTAAELVASLEAQPETLASVNTGK